MKKLGEPLNKRKGKFFGWVMQKNRGGNWEDYGKEREGGRRSPSKTIVKRAVERNPIKKKVFH